MCVNIIHEIISNQLVLCHAPTYRTFEPSQFRSFRIPRMKRQMSVFRCDCRCRCLGRSIGVALGGWCFRAVGGGSKESSGGKWTIGGVGGGGRGRRWCQPGGKDQVSMVKIRIMWNEKRTREPEKMGKRNDGIRSSYHSANFWSKSFRVMDTMGSSLMTSVQVYR